MIDFYTYIFMDDDTVIDEQLFHDDTPAEQHGLRLMKKLNKTIAVFKEIVILDPKVENEVDEK